MSIETMEARIQYLGGNTMGRMNKQKLQSFKSALKNDYNKRMISTPHKGAWPCLINTNLLKPDYDKKILSVEFDSTLNAGDVFEVFEDGSHWMVYLPDLVETAYLKSEIIRCRYTIDVNGTDYWVYFKGPDETNIDWQLKDNVNFNNLNLSGVLYIKNDENTKEFFHRFSTFKLDGHTWQCVAIDSISVPGIIEIAINEYYDNTNAELASVEEESIQTGAVIIGKQIVRQGDIVGYTIDKDKLDDSYSWKITDNKRVIIQEIQNNGRICKVEVLPGAVKTYTVSYGPYTLVVNIDITESVIKGPQTVYPYDVVEYAVEYEITYDEQGNPIIPEVGVCQFSVDGNYAKIISTTNNSCILEIVRGKSGDFVLTAIADSKTYTLPIKIESL